MAQYYKMLSTSDYKESVMDAMLAARALQQQERKREEEDPVRQMMQTQRWLKRSRGAVARQANPVLQRQQRWTEGLAREARDCHLKVAIANSCVYQREDKRDENMIHQTMSDLERDKKVIGDLERLRETLQIRLREVEQELRAVERKIADRKEVCRTMCRGLTRPEKVLRRLEITCTDFGAQLRENRRLMAEIHDLCVEKALVARIYRGLRGDHRKLSKELKDHVDSTKDAYIKRDNTNLGVQNLRDYFEKKRETFTKETSILETRMDMLKSVEKFVLGKNKELTDEGMANREKLRQQLTPSEKDNLHYRSLLDKIRAAVGEKELGEFVRTYVELLQENFMICRHVTEVRERVRDRQSEIAKTREKIAQLQAEGVRKQTTEKLQREELVEKKEFHKKRADALAEVVQERSQVLDKYKEGILSVLRGLGYTDAEIRSLTGVRGKVDEKNVLYFAGLVEAHVNKLWEVQEYVDYCDSRRVSAALTRLGPVATHARRTRPIKPLRPLTPALAEGEHEPLPKDGDRRPLLRHELTRFVYEDLDKRAAKLATAQEVVSVESSKSSMEDEPILMPRGSRLLALDVY